MINKKQSDIAKGIALLFVIISHLPRIFPEYDLFYFNPLGYLGVGIFLFLSGYGLERSYINNGLNDFWKKRVIKIFPALFVTTGLVYLFNIVIFKQIPCSVFELLLSCVGLSNKVNPVTWYMGMMWFCYLFFWIIKKMNIKTGLGGIILSLSILTISILLSGTSINMWGLNAFGFSLGMISAKEEYREFFKRRSIAVLSWILFVSLFLVYYVALGNSEIIIYRNPVKSILSLLFCIGFISILISIHNTLWLDKSVGRLGKVSYEAFLIHAPFIFAFPQFFELTNSFIMVLFYFVLTIVFSILLHFSIEKVFFTRSRG